MLIRARRAVGDFLLAGFQFGAEVEHANGWSFDVFGTTISKTVFLKPYEGETIPSNKAVLTIHFADPDSAAPVEATAIATATGQVLATMGVEDCKAFHLPLSVKFQPQQWIDDDAVDSGPAFYFDAAPAILGMTADEVRALSVQVYKEHGRDMDILAERTMLLGPGRDKHDGPFHLELEAAEFDMFLFAAGIDKTAVLTDADIAAARLSRETEIPVLKAGDWVVMASDHDRQFRVGSIPSEQPLAEHGVLIIKDTAGEQRLCVFEVWVWLQITEEKLTAEQRALLTQPSDPSLSVGDTVVMGIDAGAHIEVGHVHPVQPLASEGIFLFTDQYGDGKMAALDGNDWLVVMDHELTEGQRTLLQPPADEVSLEF